MPCGHPLKQFGPSPCLHVVFVVPLNFFLGMEIPATPQADPDYPVTRLVPEYATLSPQFISAWDGDCFVSLPVLRAGEEFDIVVAVITGFQWNSALQAHANRRGLIPAAPGRPLTLPPMTLDTAKMLVAHLSPLWLGRFLKRRPEADQQHDVDEEPVTRKVQDAGPLVDSQSPWPSSWRVATRHREASQTAESTSHPEHAFQIFYSLAALQQPTS